MKLISWNIRGLNSPKKGRLLKNMLMQEKPNILFVQETKCNMTFLAKIVVKVWPGGQISTADARGASGGLAILWDSRIIQLNNIHANKHFIQATFHLLGTNTHGHITNVYFPQDPQLKAEVLDHLTALNSNRQYPLWIAGGDFNMITRTEEKQGGRDIGIRDGQLLKDFVRSNWLIDLPSNNGIFTWTNKREGIHQIASRLDRFLISDNAPYLGGDIISSILPISSSKSWIKYQPSEKSKMARFQKKLQSLKKEIKQWNQKIFGNIFTAQATLNQEMKQIQNRIMAEGRTTALTQQEQRIEDQLQSRAQ
eukprot:PITA_21378